MALRAVPDHPKFASLKALIAQPKGATLGWLEAIWHFTGRFTPQGNIGKYTDQAIEAWVEWDGEPASLVAYLVESGWLDRDETHRLLVHDWPQHADKATKNALNRAKLDFCTPTVRTPSVESTNESLNSGNISRLPVPEPTPEPDPVPEPEPEKLSSPSAPRVETREREIIESVFGFYCVKFDKNPKRYQLTEARRKKASLRFRERLKANDGNEAAVEVEFSQAVENLAASDYHVAGGYTDWEAQIFRSQEEFEKRLNWKAGGKNNGAGRNQNSKSADQVLRELGAETGPDSPSGEDPAGASGQAGKLHDDGAVGADPDPLPW